MIEMSDPFANTLDTDAAAFLNDMSGVCPVMEFAPGEQLRIKSHHYRNMYLITHGECLVELNPGDSRQEPHACGPGDSIGEIGFLRGLPATATVTAHDKMQVRVIDDEVLAHLESEKPELVASLLQKLSEIADDRTSYDLTLSDDAEMDDSHGNVEILLCRNDEMLREAQKLRYDVYCTELKRKSPFADHKEGIITDALDAFGHCFIAVRDGKTVGTLRSNSPVEGSIGSMEQLYGMPQSEHHPEATSVTTKFIVVREMRRSPVAMQLISYASQYGMNYGVIESYIDCVPKLLPYYRAMGFSVSEKSFLHPENGPSIPMRINLVKNAKKLVGEVGLRRMITFYVRSKAYKFAERLRG